MYNILLNYKENAVKTLKYKENHKIDLSHMIIGMMSEVEELSEAIKKHDIVNISEELADIMWYCACYSYLRDNKEFENSNLYIKRVHLEIGTTLFLYDEISKLSGVVKRVIAYDKEFDIAKENQHFLDLLSCLYGLYNFFNIDINNSLINNISKLQKVRHKAGFNVGERDLESERRELEKGM